MRLTQAAINGTDVKRGGYGGTLQIAKHMHTTYPLSHDCNCPECRMKFWQRVVRKLKRITS